MSKIVIESCRINMPGIEPDAFVRIYLDEDGVATDLCKTGGCDRHLVSRDGTRHFCICPEGYRELDPKQNSVKWACLEVCEYHKQIARDLLAKSEGLLGPAEQKLREFLERENTVDWK